MSTEQFDRNAPVGVIGAGIMGTAFATNLLSRGYKVHVYNRTPERARPLADRGAVLHKSPRDLASSVSIVLTSLTDQDAVDSVALGPDGLLNGLGKGRLWMDLSTIDPDASVLHAEAARKAGVERLDVPVVGSNDLAQKGELILLVGGDERVFRKYEEFLKEIGKTVIYLGQAGNGHRMKLVINLYLGLTAESYAEALVLARKLGFDARTFIDTIDKTPHRNYYSSLKGPVIAKGDFSPAFSLNNLLKDLRLADGQARKVGAMLPLAEVALGRYASAAERGEGHLDFSVIALDLLRENGLSK